MRARKRSKFIMRDPKTSNQLLSLNAPITLQKNFEHLSSSMPAVEFSANAAAANERDVIENILRGEYEHPVRIVAFNTAEGWSRDVTENIAEKLVDVARKEGCDLNASAHAFIERFGQDGVSMHATQSSGRPPRERASYNSRCVPGPELVRQVVSRRECKSAKMEGASNVPLPRQSASRVWL